MSHKLFITSDISVDERLVDVGEESPESALLWPWLLTALDDWGRATADPKRLKYSVFPAITCVTPQSITTALELFARAGLILLYEVDGKQYLAVPSETWFKYQTHIRSEKRETDKSRYPAPPTSSSTPCARLREDARECAQSRAVVCNSQPSPSPSPSLSLSPTEEDLDAAAATPRSHARARESRVSHEDAAAAAPVSQSANDGVDDAALTRETRETLTRWKALGQRAQVPNETSLRAVQIKHLKRGMTFDDLRAETLKLEDEAAAAAGRKLTLTRLDNWLNQWHAPPPDAPRHPAGVGAARQTTPAPPTRISARESTNDWSASASAKFTPLTTGDAGSTRQSKPPGASSHPARSSGVIDLAAARAV